MQRERPAEAGRSQSRVEARRRAALGVVQIVLGLVGPGHALREGRLLLALDLLLGHALADLLGAQAVVLVELRDAVDAGREVGLLLAGALLLGLALAVLAGRVGELVGL